MKELEELQYDEGRDDDDDGDHDARGALAEKAEAALLPGSIELERWRSILLKLIEKTPPAERGDAVITLLMVNRARADFMSVLKSFHPEARMN